MPFFFKHLHPLEDSPAIGEKPAFLFAEPRRSSLILDLAVPVDRQIYRRKSAISEFPATVGWARQRGCRPGKAQDRRAARLVVKASLSRGEGESLTFVLSAKNGFPKPPPERNSSTPPVGVSQVRQNRRSHETDGVGFSGYVAVGGRSLRSGGEPQG